MGGELREISQDVKNKTEKAKQEANNMYEATGRHQWDKLLNVELTPEDVQYLTEIGKDNIHKAFFQFEQAKMKSADSPSAVDPELASKIDDKLKELKAAVGFPEK